MKKVLIISPNFPPINAADMHRVRQSLVYFPEMGWEATVVAVEPEFVEMSQDPLLMESLPETSAIKRIRAFNRISRQIEQHLLQSHGITQQQGRQIGVDAKKQFDILVPHNRKKEYFQGA